MNKQRPNSHRNSLVAARPGACAEPLERRTLLAALTIAQENALKGTPDTVWDVAGAGDTTIQGFVDGFSLNVGQTANFKVNDTARAAYHIDIYRVGYYQGNGARLITTIPSSQTQRTAQPSPRTNSTTGEVDCGNWSVTASWAIPSDATSGVYLANAVREDTGGKAQMIFVVRNDASHSDILFQTSDTTWQAYNNWGGKSLYDYQSTNNVPAVKVSYNRPFNTRGNSAEDYFFNAEYPMVRWLESNGYDVSYFSGIDAERSGSLIRNHDAYLSVGHDEYWSGNQRANVEAARDAGVNLAFLSGNEVFWKTRWENSIDGNNTPYRTLVCYKETAKNARTDPLDPPIWTGTWRDPRFSPPADGGRPENALTGTIFMVNGERNDAIKVPAAYAKLRLWRNTSVANLTGSQVATFPTGTLGYEWDADLDNGFRPAGLFDLSSTVVSMSGSYVLKDYGTTYGSGTVEHELTMYRAASGALVFGAGTVQWSWGLDNDHDRGSAAPDVRMQQATVNLLADMSAQPSTLRSGLVATSKSTDTTKPTSSMSSGSTITVTAGRATTVSGTAADGGGGQVAGIEVSIDGGATWHPADGTTSWSYRWTPSSSGTIQVLSRAVDDSGNLEVPGGGGPGPGSGTPPTGQNIWSGSPIPAVQSDPDAVPVELGVKFRTDVGGTITGIRFYKGSNNTGTHIGNLWTRTGSLLASATFSGETASGWQYVSFPTPVTIQPNTTYVASYHTDTGHYAEDAGYFSSTGVDNGPLHALRSGVDGVNGVARYGSTAFPNQNFGANNYWVDVYFNPSGTDTTPPAVTAQSPAPNATNVPANTSVTATFSESIQSSSLTFTLRNSSNVNVAGTATYNDTNRTATFAPSAALAAGTTYTASVSARDIAGNLMSAVTWSFTTAAASDTTPPAVTGTSPASGATGVPTASAVTATFSESVSPSSLAFTLRDPANAPVTGSVTYNDATRTATFTPSAPLAASATYTAAVTASDLAGNAMATAFAWSFTTSATVTQTIFGSAVPTTPADSDTAAVEVGVKFTADVNGTITGIRFYKGTGNTGTHVGNLWTASGTKLASGTFINESATGWQTLTFTSPVSVTAGTVYVASYFAPGGHYAADDNYFATQGAGTGQVHALANGASGPNGVYRYGSASAFPSTGYLSTNYWVDVLFTPSSSGPADTTPPSVTATSPAAGATGVSTGTAVSATFNESLNPSSVAFTLRNPAGTSVAGSAVYNETTKSVTFTPSAALATGTTYTASVSASDAAGNAMASPFTWSFTTAVTQSQEISFWTDQATPQVAADPDAVATELGVKFRSDVPGFITGIRFYKSSTNTGTHIAHLWTRTGTLLATATFVNETASGWQTVRFSQPVPIQANTTYVASYHTDTGHYAEDANAFQSAGVDSGPLHILRSGVDGANGVARYGGSAFPNQNFGPNNYWVDVLFTQ